MNHFGHSLDVHNIHYQATSDVIERSQIAKILLLQDHDNIGAFANKRLRDISWEGKPDLIITTQQKYQSCNP